MHEAYQGNVIWIYRCPSILTRNYWPDVNYGISVRLIVSNCWTFDILATLRCKLLDTIALVNHSTGLRVGLRRTPICSICLQPMYPCHHSLQCRYCGCRSGIRCSKIFDYHVMNWAIRLFKTYVEMCSKKITKCPKLMHVTNHKFNTK